MRKYFGVIVQIGCLTKPGLLRCRRCRRRAAPSLPPSPASGGGGQRSGALPSMQLCRTLPLPAGHLDTPREPARCRIRETDRETQESSASRRFVRERYGWRGFGWRHGGVRCQSADGGDQRRGECGGCPHGHYAAGEGVLLSGSLTQGVLE